MTSSPKNHISVLKDSNYGVWREKSKSDYNAEVVKNTEIAIFFMLYVSIVPFICICISITLRKYCAKLKKVKE